MVSIIRKALLRFSRAPIVLTVMRLEDMLRVHPAQITATCARCGHDVGVYPSGQSVMAKYGKRVELVCHVCRTPGANAVLAPGAETEPSESQWRKP